MEKGFEAARLRQARLSVAVRRGKRAERTHAVLIESNANDKREAKLNEKNASTPVLAGAPIVYVFTSVALPSNYKYAFGLDSQAMATFAGWVSIFSSFLIILRIGIS